MESLDETTSQFIRSEMEKHIGGDIIVFHSGLYKRMKESVDGMISIRLVCLSVRELLGLEEETDPRRIDTNIVKAVGAVLADSDLLKVSEDGLRVGRAKPMPYSATKDDIDANTIVVSPFEDHVHAAELFGVFKPHAKVRSVSWIPRMDGIGLPRTPLVDFTTPEDASKILGEKVEFGEAVLEIKPKEEFDREFYEKLNVNKIGIVSFKLELSKSEVLEDDVSLDNLKSLFQDFGSVRDIDFNPTLKSGYVQFDYKDAVASKIVAQAIANEGGLPVKNSVIILDPVTGSEAEENFGGHAGRERMDDKGEKKRLRDDDAGCANKVQKH